MFYFYLFIIAVFGKLGVNSSDFVIDQVVVRIRPANDLERDANRTVKKVSSDSLAVGERKFAFDSVLDSNSNQV